MWSSTLFFRTCRLHLPVGDYKILVAIQASSFPRALCVRVRPFQSSPGRTCAGVPLETVVSGDAPLVLANEQWAHGVLGPRDEVVEFFQVPPG
jgi:hypothetical protein